jgi:hypothetical protein
MLRDGRMRRIAALLLAALLWPASGTFAQSSPAAADAKPRFAARTAARIGRAHDTAALAVGEALYRQGMASSGQPLEARRDNGLLTRGAGAACVNCHQRSGFGSQEGDSFIPPIAGRYLFHPRAQLVEDLNLPSVEGMRPDREPYTDESLARAIREGINSEGKPFNYLMPRYAMSDADMAALIGYLKSLDQRVRPGVSAAVLDFATIITPDADPLERDGFLDVLEHYFTENNGTQRGPALRKRTDGRVMMAYKINPSWQLHIWSLHGPPATWQPQLEQHLAKEPVLAVLSGLGRGEWAPVHDFCERAALPCLFPNVEVPAGSAGDLYSMYFSGGVLLEAELIASQILGAAGADRVKTLTQVYRAGDSGEAAARALAASLRDQGVVLSSRVLAPAASASDLTLAVRAASGADALVLWLRSADLAALGEPPNPRSQIFLSGLMAGLESAPLPPGWRGRTYLTYPFELPERQGVRTDYARGWFSLRQIPVVAEHVQADTYLACQMVSEALGHMVDNFSRDYLVEELQHLLEHRVLTGYYPHLALAPGQRFASKGGYIARFADATGTRLVAEVGYTVP